MSDDDDMWRSTGLPAPTPLDMAMSALPADNVCYGCGEGGRAGQMAAPLVARAPLERGDPFRAYVNICAYINANVVRPHNAAQRVHLGADAEPLPEWTEAGVAVHFLEHVATANANANASASASASARALSLPPEDTISREYEFSPTRFSFTPASRLQ